MIKFIKDVLCYMCMNIESKEMKRVRERKWVFVSHRLDADILWNNCANGSASGLYIVYGIVVVVNGSALVPRDAYAGSKRNFHNSTAVTWCDVMFINKLDFHSGLRILNTI